MTSQTTHIARIASTGALAAAFFIGTAAPAAEAAAPAATAPREGQQAEPRAGAWTTPLFGKHRISKRWGVKGNYAGGRHTGIDLAVRSGTPVRSVGAGRVVFSGRSGDYGKAVTIHMRDGRYTLYAHLSRLGVRKGQRVGVGTRIAKSGNTGRSTGPHLHFEVRAKRGYGSDINPVSYLARKGVRLL
ncbi:M23 family metallopeptidase [Streptomyces sp. ODS28]|uniref:M23 family metallopeptidase n=1 Tax=Streptomyces sp. ODS28 TaxID=3136688 RepID=UPI0031E5C343